MVNVSVKLTEYSHGAGCGCKIAPETLSTIVAASKSTVQFSSLLVGNSQQDDAAVVAIDEHRAIVSTTDFFMPIVDDAHDFGRIAAANAISDIYAMGGKPICAIAILGWPVDKLPASVAAEVIAGGREQCDMANIPLAGGHSIDAPEPIFGLAVTGLIDRSNIALNGGCKAGDKLYLTKPLGIGIVTTAQKRQIVKAQHIGQVTQLMTTLNTFGEHAAKIDGVSAMTDVTGFGLFGHAVEMARASGCTIEVVANSVPFVEGVDDYISQGAVPGGSQRNYASFTGEVDNMTDLQIAKYFDPQTSGGLLIAVDEASAKRLEQEASQRGQSIYYIGDVTTRTSRLVTLK